ncbi:MAG: hypothetical protein F6K10_33230 [Moorea sp. SIO2B7]|nr:hypothetical protein [Moorena sp. SIO2B7]
MKQEIGALMYLYMEEIEPGEPIEASEFLIIETAKALNEAGGNNWLPIIVKQIGEDQYKVVGNSFVYAVAEEAGLEKVWCIIADESEKIEKLSRLLAQEELPKIDLAKASRDEIKAGIEYLIKRPVNRLSGVKPAVAISRIYEAPRRYWKENLMDVTKLKCGITKGKKLGIFKEIFYVTSEPLPEIIKDPTILELFTVGELKKMAKKRSITGYSNKKRTALIKMLSE